MMKIAKSLAMIAFVAAIGVYATGSFFSDVETSKNNTFTAGTIDISVDGENPWNTSWSNYLDKPCQVNYMVFDIENVGENPANIWKRIMNVETNGGSEGYVCDPGVIGSETCPVVNVSSEPECEEGTKNYTQCYVERDNLASYIIYDMTICKYPFAGGVNCPYINDDPELGPDLSGSHNWEVIIPEENEVRIDNVNGIWIKLDDVLEPGRILRVVQSYHLKAWNDAGEETITNWAQGDVMTFDIELEARQIDAPAPVGVNDGTLVLENKDSSSWDPIFGDNIGGTLTYNTSGPLFNWTLNATVTQNENYCLIYYPDPWPGHVGGFAIKCGITPTSGVISTFGGKDIGDIPILTDDNYPGGAKIWLVLDSDYDQNTGKMIGWAHDDYLFEMNLIKYDKTP